MQQCAQSMPAGIVSAQGPVLYRAPIWPLPAIPLLTERGVYKAKRMCPPSPHCGYLVPQNSLSKQPQAHFQPAGVSPSPGPPSKSAATAHIPRLDEWLRAAVCRREADRAWVCGSPRVGREGTRAGKRRKRASEPEATSWPEPLRSWRILNSHLIFHVL